MKEAPLNIQTPNPNGYRVEHPISVMVTGSNGQLGKCIKDLEKQHPYLSFIYTDYQSLDICDSNQVQSFFNVNTVKYCINCAAYTAVDKAEKEREKAFSINATGPKNLALACKENNVVLIHISTDFVFDGNKKEPYKETDVPHPINVYGASKLQGEVEIQNILNEHFIIRTSWLYSEHGHNFMKTMLKLSDTKNELSVVNDQIGTPTYAGDLAEVVLNVIVTKKTEYGLYHYSNWGEISWYDFAKTIFIEANKEINVNPIKTEQFSTLARRPKYSVLNKKKIKTISNMEIPNWDDSLRKVIKKT